MSNVRQKTESLLYRAGTARSRDLVAEGINRSQLSRMVKAGIIKRVARGIYALADYQGGEYSSLVTIAKRSPNTLFCLLTALRLHDLTTQAPFEVWIAIGNKDHPPRINYPPLRVVRFSETSLTTGVETRQIEGAKVRVTNIAKTLADCFKFRNKIGIDVAIEALREARRAKKMDADEIWRFAKLNRVAAVMRPYLEAIA